MIRLALGLSLATTLSASLVAQSKPGHGDERLPMLINLSRAEQLEAAIHAYVAEFVGAIRRGDTLALAALAPEETLPAAERSAAARAGCLSMGRAVSALRLKRAGESSNPALPLAGVSSSEPATSSVTTNFPEPQSQCTFMRNDLQGYLIQAVF